MKRKLEGDSSIGVPKYVKDYFDEIKQNFAWIVQTKLNKKTVYTLRFQHGDGDSRFFIWNDKVLFFKRSLELAQYVMSANSSNAASSPFAQNRVFSCAALSHNKQRTGGHLLSRTDVHYGF
jgi:hypothetical protein